jgi:hypothetical protein
MIKMCGACVEPVVDLVDKDGDYITVDADTLSEEEEEFLAEGKRVSYDSRWHVIHQCIEE